MDGLQFVNTIVPDDGFYCIFAEKNKGDIVRQNLYDSLDTAIAAAHSLDADGFNSYFALSSFQTKDSRLATNALSTKSFFLDLDVGQQYVDIGKGYLTQTEAWEALATFCKDTGMPHPVVVNSGRGLHVYWPFTEAVSKAEWVAVATQFKNLAMSSGLLIDPAVPADSARVLRVPTTHNHKDSPPSEVTVLTEVKLFDFDELSEIIGVTMPVPTIFKPSSKAVALLEHDNALTGYDENYANSFKLIKKKTMAGKGCGQIKHIMQNPIGLDEPMWRAGLSIMKYCKGGDEIAHDFSAQDVAQYDERETSKKLEGIAGPHICSTFNGLTPGICEECPHWGKIKSPIVLGREFQEALPTPSSWDAESTSKDVSVDRRPPCPTGWVWGGNSPGIYKVETDDGDKKEIEIYEHDLYLLNCVDDDHDGNGTGQVAIFEDVKRSGERREVIIPMEKMASVDLKKVLAKHGVFSAYHWSSLANYVMQSIAKYYGDKRIPVKVKRQFGWTDNNKGFVVGGREYRANDAHRRNYSAPPTKQFFSAFEPKGTLERWKFMASCYNAPGMELRQMSVLIGLASPFMELIDGVACCGFHMYSKDGGLGKTSALNALLTPWGNPAKLRTKKRDTQNFRMNRAEVYKNLPLSVDEMTNVEPIEMSDVVYDLTAGSQKGRMSGSANEERPTGDEWSLLCVTTANTSLLDQIALGKNDPNAESQRIMECHFERVPWDVEVAEFNEALRNNYGHAGPILIQYALDHLEEVKVRLKACCEYVIKRFNLKDENRFWAAGLGCILMTLQLSIKLELLEYSVPGIETYMSKLVELNQQNIEAHVQTVQDLISQYVMVHNSGILKMDSHADGRKKGELGGGYTLPQRIYAPIVGRYEKDTNILALDLNTFRKWLSATQAGDKSTINAIKKEMGGVIVPKYNLTKGSDATPARPTVILIKGYDLDSDDEDIH
jgi:hypothetical protein